MILVVVDRFTKYAQFLPLAHPYSAASVAEVFIHGVFKLHGLPKTIISDRDPLFLSMFWTTFFKTQGTELCKSTAYHPQSDGQIENLNRSLEQYLRCVAGEIHGRITCSVWTHYVVYLCVNVYLTVFNVDIVPRRITCFA